MFESGGPLLVVAQVSTRRKNVFMAVINFFISVV
jgi:hypothetical protein